LGLSPGQQLGSSVQASGPTEGARPGPLRTGRGAAATRLWRSGRGRCVRCARCAPDRRMGRGCPCAIRGQTLRLWFSPHPYDRRPADQAERSHLDRCPARRRPTASKLLVARSATLAAPRRPNSGVALDPDPPAGNGPGSRTVNQRQVQRPSGRQSHARPGPGPPSRSMIIREGWKSQ